MIVIWLVIKDGRMAVYSSEGTKHFWKDPEFNGDLLQTVKEQFEEDGYEVIIKEGAS